MSVSTRVARALDGAKDRAAPDGVKAPTSPEGAIANLQGTHGNQALLRMLDRKPAVIQRKRCSCGGESGPDGECAACKAKRTALQRRAVSGGDEPAAIP